MDQKQPRSGRRKLLMIVGFFVVLPVIAVIIIQQSRSVASYEPAFHVSEAGLHYALHLLNSSVCTPDELSRQPLVQSVPSEAGAASVGTFEVAVAAIGATRWQVTATGHEPGLMGECAEMAAEVEMFNGILGTKYRIVSWGKRSTVRCSTKPVLSEVSCAGVRPTNQ